MKGDDLTAVWGALTGPARDSGSAARAPANMILGGNRCIKLTSVYVDDQDKTLRSYTEAQGLVKKADVSQAPFRWPTVASPEDLAGTELQLALNDNPAARAYQQAMLQHQ